MNTIISPLSAPARTRGTLVSARPFGAVAQVAAPLMWSAIDAAPSCSGNGRNTADASTRGTTLGNSYGDVRVETAAATGAVPAAHEFGRKQGRPPRGEPR